MRRWTPAKIGALGYCFGGSTVLELARSGADIAGVVTFHGGLSTPMPAKPGAVKTSVLVLNGADDKGTAGDIAGFQQEMNDAGADWQFVNFSGAVHCFALPTANRPGCMYNERAATRGELMMRNFFAERFAKDEVSFRSAALPRRCELRPCAVGNDVAESSRYALSGRG